MTELVVCRAPGDELSEFGGLLLSRPPREVDVVAVFAHPRVPDLAAGEARFRAACRAAGAREARLLPFAHLEHDPVDPRLIAAHLCELGQYTRIYTHSIQDPRPLCQRTAAAVGRAASTVWTTAGGGGVDEIEQGSPHAFERRLALLAEHYPDLLAEDWIQARDLRAVHLLQQHPGERLYRYFAGYVDWHVGDFDYCRPWELETSAYERRRYAAELDALRRFPWQTLVEVGACEGAFTERLLAAFPERRVIAVEPDPFFFTSLQQRLGGRAELYQADASAAGELACDVVFMSSTVYYLWKIPYPMLRNARYVVVSHATRYHRDRLDPVLRAQGFVALHEDVVPACVEPMEGILEVKYGTEIKTWQRCAAAPGQGRSSH